MISKSVSLPFCSLIFVKTIFWKIIVFKTFCLYLHPIKMLIMVKKKTHINLLREHYLPFYLKLYK